MTTDSNTDPFLQDVINAFNQFKGVSTNFDVFWERANIFHACLRCYFAAEAKWGPDSAALQGTVDDLIQTNYDYLNSFLTDKGYWADDYGWCGLASLAAWEYLGQPDNAKRNPTVSQANYQQLAEDSWTQMKTRGYDGTAAASPVTHGCSNADGYTPPHNPGTKNTVVNALFLLLSVRLAQTVKQTPGGDPAPYLQMAYGQYLWFRDWFGKFQEFDYLRLVSDLGGLVHERPYAEISGSTYKTTENPPSKTTEKPPSGVPGSAWTWSGDQGLLLAAFTGLLASTSDIAGWVESADPPVWFEQNTFLSDISGWFDIIASGVQNLLFFTVSDTPGINPDLVLREAPFSPGFADNTDAYVCGRGVLLRYLGEIRNDLPSNFDFSAGILATAKAALASCDTTTHQFGPNWNLENTPAFNQYFIDNWGTADSNGIWPDSISSDSGKNAKYVGVLQGIGLDVLGAAITFDVDPAS